ncbi:VWA domain-containing protein [Candidatus Binatia bacterium]|nr:VWA domain-containing protein [Candidatus Binatia bacterium]
MIEPWLRLGDRGLGFASSQYVPLAWGALLIVVLAIVTQLRRRAAARAGWPVPAAWRLWTATFVRVCAYLCMVAAVAGATLVETEREDRLTVVAAQDVSQSIPRGEGVWMRDWLEDLVGAMRRDDEFALLAFGRDASLVSGPGAPVLADDTAPEVDGSASNLMTAIDSGASLASAHGGALVLLTDGNQNAGDAVVAAESARRRGVRVFPVVPPRHQAPLTIERVSAPDVARQGSDVKLSVAIANRGSEPLEATLVARQGDQELGRVPLRVAPGRSVVDAEVRAGQPGHYAVTVALEAPPEVASPRARRGTTLSVLAPPRVLLISADAALAPLLRDAGFEVERRGQLGAVSATELGRYHAVVLGTVSRDDVAPAALDALEEYVRDLGGGLLVAAGRGIVSDARLRGSALERLLPVRVREQKPKEKVREPMALFLVIDRSSSMSYGVRLDQPNPSRIAYAREAALALIGQLEDRDEVGAVAFDTETSLLAPLAPLKESRARLSDLISRLQPSGGTDFKEALEIAARQLIASGVSTKHVILLSDGASIRPAAEHDQLTAALVRAGVTVTSIRIGDDRDSYALVKQISEATGGSFHLVTDAVSLPSLMIEDARKRSGREKDEEQPTDAPFHPRVAVQGEALGGLKDRDLPVLREAASVPLKPGATAWLTGGPGGDASPILAGWQNGLGRVAVFTANPGSEWQSWGQVRRFWSQLVRWLARPQSADEVRLAVRQDGVVPVLSIDTYDGAADGSLTLKITGRDGTVRELAPPALGARHHEVALPPLDTIEPRVTIEKRRGRELVFARDEWLPAATGEQQIGSEDAEAEPNRALLSQIAEITGGAVDAPLAEILKRAPAERQSTFPLVHLLAIAAFALALVDIGVRLVGVRDPAL